MLTYISGILMYGGEECDSDDILEFDLVNQVCLEFADSCRRSMCECYRRFYNQIQISTSPPTHKERCLVDENFHSIACCSNISQTSPFILYDADKVKCMLDGSVAELGKSFL